MPIYEYKCEACQKVTEVLQSMTEPPLTKCPSCAGGLTKLISMSSFKLKGGGWYADGYGNGKNGNGKSCNDTCSSATSTCGGSSATSSSATTTSTGSGSEACSAKSESPCSSCPSSATTASTS